MRALLVIPDFGGGGAERTFVNLANHLPGSGVDVEVAVYRAAGPLRGFLRADARVHDLGAPRARHAVLPLARLIRRERPDVVCSTLLHPNVVAYAAARLARHRGVLVLRESNHWSAAGRPSADLSARAVGHAYRHATRVVCLSRGVAEDCVERYRLDPGSVRVVYNPIDVERVQALAKEAPQVPAEAGVFRIVAVGRLVRQKGFDLLIEGLAGLEDVPWHLTLVGEGPERAALEALASARGVSSRVSFAGYLENPYAVVRSSDLFVLSSRWEGFGHVIAEAMACGTPVLATRCRSGPDEIVTDGVDGVLCEPDSPEGLRKAIGSLAMDARGRASIAAAGLRSVDRFRASRIASEYAQVFEEALS